MTEGVVDLVTNRWLSPQVISEKLSDVQIAEGLIRMMQEPQNKSRVVDFLRDIILKFAESIDRPEVAQLLQKILKDQIEGIDIATPFGLWLEKTIRNGDHLQLWDMILTSVERSINEDSTRHMLIGKINTRINEYKNEGFFKNAFISIGEWVGGVDADSVASKIISTVIEFIYEAKNNSIHPARIKFETSILEFA